MSTTYEWLAQFAQSAGTVYFFLFFLANARLRALAEKQRALQ